MSPGTTGITSFTCTCNSMYVCYPTARIHPSPSMELKLPDIRGIYILPLNVVANQTQTSVTIAVPGRPMYLYHYFLLTAPNALAGQVSTSTVYSLSPNATNDTLPAGPNLTFQQCNIGGNTFPLNPQYTTGSGNYGSVAQFYHEFQTLSNNFISGCSTQVTYSNYISKYRIYGIDLSGCDIHNATIQFNAQYSSQTIAAGSSLQHILFCLYQPR